MKRKRKTKKKFFNKKHIAIFGISLAVILAAFVVIMGMGGLFPFEYDSIEEILEPVDKATGKVNALIVGIEASGSHTDTIMVASYDLDDNTVNILSIPRDTRMYIGNKYQKINAAHVIADKGDSKGINGTIEAVTRLTGIPINYYVEFSTSAFRETIDALGGIDFYVPQNMNYDDPVQNLHIHLSKGYQHLDGDKAEQFVRFRKYPMGDIDRVAAQQSFLKALAEQKLNAGIITKIPEIYTALQKNIKTNLTISDVTKYAINLKDLTSENIHMYSVPGVSNGTDYDASYWIPDMTQLATLIQDTFGYDASNITIHSADGKSQSKDVKKNKATAAKEKNTVKNEDKKSTEKPKVTHTPQPTHKPSSTTETTKAPEATAHPPKATPVPEKPIATKTPEEKPKETDSATVKRPPANVVQNED
ncbi:MAG: LCP family protein [Firmicutes bacterium]|nr:LCP family protein [Bacillota bacterium]